VLLLLLLLSSSSAELSDSRLRLRHRCQMLLLLLPCAWLVSACKLARISAMQSRQYQQRHVCSDKGRGWAYVCELVYC
jgi:hypothetical protein